MNAGDVVLLRFPFSDLSGAKLRPAVVLAVVDHEEFIACQITSKRKTDRRAIGLTSGSFAAGDLRLASYVRPAKLFTAHRTIVAKRVGRLRDAVRDAIQTSVINVIRGK